MSSTSLYPRDRASVRASNSNVIHAIAGVARDIYRSHLSGLVNPVHAFAVYVERVHNGSTVHVQVRTVGDLAMINPAVANQAKTFPFHDSIMIVATCGYEDPHAPPGFPMLESTVAKVPLHTSNMQFPRARSPLHT